MVYIIALLLLIPEKRIEKKSKLTPPLASPIKVFQWVMTFISISFNPLIPKIITDYLSLICLKVLQKKIKILEFMNNQRSDTTCKSKVYK